MHFAGELGHLSLVNVYNDCTHNKVLSSLSQFLSSSILQLWPSANDHMLWVRNFNQHYPLWEAFHNRHLNSSREFIQPLLDLLADYDMELALPPGIPTLQSLADTRTRPDNVWRSHADSDPVIYCKVDALLCPLLAYHLPIVIMIDLLIARASSTPFHDFQLVDWDLFTDTLMEHLQACSLAQYIPSAAQFHRKVSNLFSIIQEVIALDDIVPL